MPSLYLISHISIIDVILWSLGTCYEQDDLCFIVEKTSERCYRSITEHMGRYNMSLSCQTKEILLIKYW